MALKNQVPNVYSVGLRNAGSYQVSGHPYMSGSTLSTTLGSNVDGRFVFPYVSKTIRVSNDDSTNNLILSFAPFLNSQTASFGFTNSASGSGNWLLIKPGNTIELDAKSKEVFLAPAAATNVSCSVFAELTNIPALRLYSYDGLEGITEVSASSTPAGNGLKNQVPNVYSVGVRNVASYLVSGQPYLTGSFIDGSVNSISAGAELKVQLPRVTKSLTLWNYSSGANTKLRLTFVPTGSISNYATGGNYIELAKDESITLNVKCKEVYLSAISGEVKWKLYASLTEIPRERMYALTGSGISE